MAELFSLIDKLATNHSLTLAEYRTLIEGQTSELQQYAAEKADATRRHIYANHVYIRGLIEIGNICRNDCLYCGIRRSNNNCERYILSDEEILSCCKKVMHWAFAPLYCRAAKESFPRSEPATSCVRLKVNSLTAP